MHSGLPKSFYFGRMRKWVVLSLLLFVLFFGFVYLAIPATITFKRSVRIPVNAKAFTRVFLHSDSEQFRLTNKDAILVAANDFTYNGNAFTLLEKRLSSKRFIVRKQGDSALAELLLIPFTTDTVELNFLGVKKAGLNPIVRVQNYFRAKRLATDFQDVLQKMQLFYADTKNIYGFDIKKELVDDTTLVSTYTLLKNYPSADVIYNMVERVKAYAENNNAKPTDFPMLNITVTEDSNYLTRVALPLDKRIQGAGDIQVKWMMNKGDILVTEVRGGPAQIQKALAAMGEYASDHQRATAAIPFQSLVTDRRSERDTLKWVTKIYWPIM